MFNQLPNPKQKDIDEAVVRAHQLRAEYIAEVTHKIWTFIKFWK